MHFTIHLLCLLSTGASALPPFTTRQFSYDGPLGAAHACPNVEQQILSLDGDIVGAPPNYPNYQCLPMSTSVDWVGINLFLSNSTALKVYSDARCANRISFLERPSGLGDGHHQFCARQSENGGVGSWKAVMYAVP